MYAENLVIGQTYDYRRSPTDIRRVTYTGAVGAVWHRFEYADKSSICINVGTLYRIVQVKHPQIRYNQ